jgi:hypothetical protein
VSPRRGHGQAPARRGPLTAEDGASTIGSVFGVLIFLIFLLFSVQVLVHLFGSSTVSAVAFDNARLLAAGELDRDEAAERIRTQLGRYGDEVTVDLTASTPDDVVVTVSGPSPARLVTMVTELAGLDGIERTVRVRVEDFRP